ncbi:hypothetical protein [Daejeonella sp.]
MRKYKFGKVIPHKACFRM